MKPSEVGASSPVLSTSLSSGTGAVHYWEPINTIYKLDITVVNPTVDPAFSFMTRRSRRQDPHGLL
jgi:phosphoglucomutase